MKGLRRLRVAATLVAAGLFLAGCSTLDVRAPDGMFLSTGDYVQGSRTLGVIQESATVFAPLFLIDINQVNQWPPRPGARQEG